MTFKRLVVIPNVAGLVRPMVQEQNGYKHVLICCHFKTRQRDKSLRYTSEPVVMYSITPSIVMQKRKIIIFNLEMNLKNAGKYRCNKRMRALLLHAACCSCCMLLHLLHASASALSAAAASAAASASAAVSAAAVAAAAATVAAIF